MGNRRVAFRWLLLRAAQRAAQRVSGAGRSGIDARPVVRL